MPLPLASNASSTHMMAYIVRGGPCTLWYECQICWSGTPVN